MKNLIVIQAGHCHRKTGAVGTSSADGYREQQFTWATATRTVDMLRAAGRAALVLEADVPDYAYRGSVFVAIHADGNNNPSVKGASVGYRTPEGKALAEAWKTAYRNLGWGHGFRADNYTAALSGYYGMKRAVAQGNRAACIIEAGFLTNPAEAAELRSSNGQERCARAICQAIGVAIDGTPTTAPSTEEDIMAADPRGTARIAMRQFLGRSPKDYNELNFHASLITKRGLNAYIEWLERTDEAVAWARKIGAEVRSPDPT